MQKLQRDGEAQTGEESTMICVTQRRRRNGVRGDLSVFIFTGFSFDTIFCHNFYTSLSFNINLAANLVITRSFIDDASCILIIEAANCAPNRHWI